MHFVRLALHFFRTGALKEFQYPSHFYMQILQAITGLATGLIGLWLVFSHTRTLAGWTPAELLVVMGVHILLGGVIKMIIQPNMDRLMNDIRMGTLDYALTKPVDLQFLISVREVRIWQSVDIIVGFAVISFAVDQSTSTLTLAQSVIFAATLVLGGLMIYSFWLSLATTAFWFIRTEQLSELFGGVYQAGRWPTSVYPGWLRGGLTFLVPVAFAVTAPAEALTGRLDGQTLALAVGLAAASMFTARQVWRTGLRSYSGASA